MKAETERRRGELSKVTLQLSAEEFKAVAWVVREAASGYAYADDGATKLIAPEFADALSEIAIEDFLA